MLSLDLIVNLSETFRLLGDPTRLKLVIACLNGPKNVGELAIETNASQPQVSHHLRLLRSVRILQSERNGKHIFYRLPDCHVRQMLTNMIDHTSELHEDDEAL